MLTYFYSIVLLYLVGLLACMWKVRKLKNGGYEEMEHCDCWNPKKWVSFALGFALKHLVADFVFEQYVIRMYDPYCRPNCYEAEDGKCVKCGCDAIAKAMSPSETCSKGQWGPVDFNRKRYEGHRKQYPIKIKVER